MILISCWVVSIFKLCKIVKIHVTLFVLVVMAEKANGTLIVQKLIQTKKRMTVNELKYMLNSLKLIFVLKKHSWMILSR